MMMNLYLADVMIPGEWLIAIVVAIIGAIGGVWIKAKRAGLAEATNNVTIKSPVPMLDVMTKEHPEFVTHTLLNGHLTRIEDTFEEIKDALDGERGIARTANGNLHKRIDALSERLGDRLSNLEGITKGVETTANKLLDLALNQPKKPGTRQ